MLATLLPLAGYLLYILCMTALPFLVFKAISTTFPSLLEEFTLVVVWIAIFLPLTIKNFPWLALIAELPVSLPSSVYEMIVTLVGLAGYFVCMTGLSFLVVITARVVCEAASRPVPEVEMPPDWMLMIVLGAPFMIMDMFMKHSSHSHMMAMLFSLAGYLVHIVCMPALSYLVFRGAMSAFSVPKKLDVCAATIAIFLTLALKNFPFIALISEFPSTLPSSVFEIMATLVGLASYIVCMTGLSFLVLIIAICACEIALLPHSEEESPDWKDMIEIGVTVVLMDMFMKHSSHSIMMSMLFSFSGYLVYILCITGLLYLVFHGAKSAFQLEKDSWAELFVALITISVLLALKNVQWLALISEFPSSLPSSVPEMIATVAGLASYLVCMTGLSFLVIMIACLIFEIALGPYPEKTPDWIDTIAFGITVVVMDMFMKHSSHSNMMAILLFAGYLVYILCMMGLSYLVFEILVFDDTIVPVLPSLLPIPLNYQRWVPIIVAGVILVLNDMHGLTPLEKPAFISESLSDLPSIVSGKLLGYLVYIVCTVALSFFLLTIAVGAICKIKTLWPMERPELMLTTVVGITFMLLNMMWGTPFERPSSDFDMKSILVGLAGYLIYILCSTALTGLLSKSMTDAFVISLTFVLLDMFSISDILSTLVGLIWTTATSVLALLFLVASSFVVSMGLHTWVAMLLPSAVKNYRQLAFTSIVGFSFKVMKIMLDIPAVEKLSILSNMKAALLGIADLRKDYHVVYLVIRYLTVLALPCLFMESRYKTSTCKLHATTAIIIALGLVLTMPLSPPKPIKDLALQAMVLDDIIQRTVTSFITHTILIMVTLIGGMVFYVQDQYPLWKLAITTRYGEFKKDAGQEAKSFVNHLVYKSTLGCFGKKKVNASKRAPRR